MYTHRPALKNAGLFGVTGEGEISGVVLENVYIEGGSTGALAGHSVGTIITDVHASSGRVKGNDSGIAEGAKGTGGLLGEFDSKNNNTLGLLQNSSANVQVEGGNAGGLVGGNDGALIINCHAAGDVTGIGAFVGGLVGLNTSGSIINSYALGTVHGGTANIGGLTGFNISGIIRSSYSAGMFSAATVLV